MPFKERYRALKKALEDAPRCGKSPRRLKDVKVTPMEPTYLIRDNPPRSYDIVLCKFIGKAMVETRPSPVTRTAWWHAGAVSTRADSIEFGDCPYQPRRSPRLLLPDHGRKK